MLRVVSWNVRSLRDGAREVAAVLRQLSPDLVVLQEAPRLIGWRSSRALLARRAGLRLATSARAAGNLLLVAPGVRVTGWSAVLLPRRPGLHRRAVAVARVEVGGREMLLAGTHLDLDPQARLDSAGQVRAAVAAQEPAAPLVLGADVNEEPGEPAWRRLADGLLDVRQGTGPTFPARAPSRHLDALFVSPQLSVASCRVVATGSASDHLALLAELRWPKSHL